MESLYENHKYQGPTKAQRAEQHVKQHAALHGNQVFYPSLLLSLMVEPEPKLPVFMKR